MKATLYAIFFSIILASCTVGNSKNIDEIIIVNDSVPEDIDKKPFELFFGENIDFTSKEFQMPVGPPDAKGYYDAQSFGINLHLGEDWNGVGGGDTDLGDPVYCIADGYVSSARDYKSGWGNIVRVIHKLPESHEYEYVESIYAHLDSILVKEGDKVFMETQLGTIGNAHGSYLAHLHFELRHNVDELIGGGYSSYTEGYLNPSEFIKQNSSID